MLPFEGPLIPGDFRSETAWITMNATSNTFLKRMKQAYINSFTLGTSTRKTRKSKTQSVALIQRIEIAIKGSFSRQFNDPIPLPLLVLIKLNSHDLNLTHKTFPQELHYDEEWYCNALATNDSCQNLANMLPISNTPNTHEPVSRTTTSTRRSIRVPEQASLSDHTGRSVRHR